MVQAWALDYFLRMERRVYVKDQEDIIEENRYSTFAALNQLDRWKQLFDHDAPVMGPDGLPEQNITEDQLDQLFHSLAAQQGMTGAQAEHQIQSRLFGQADGEGRRV